MMKPALIFCYWLRRSQSVLLITEIMAGRWFSPSYAKAAERFGDACENIRKEGHKINHERLDLGLIGPDDCL